MLHNYNLYFVQPCNIVIIFFNFLFWTFGNGDPWSTTITSGSPPVKAAGSRWRLACTVVLTCECVCMHAYMYVYVYTYVYKYVCMHVYTYVCMYACIYMHICMYVYTHIRMYVYTYVCMCVCMYVYTYVCILTSSASTWAKSGSSQRGPPITKLREAFLEFAAASSALSAAALCININI